MQGETLNEQSGIQNAFQKSAQLDMAVSVFFSFPLLRDRSESPFLPQ